MKILITGGAGFIGSHLANKLLDENHKVVIIDNLSTGRFDNIEKFIDSIDFINDDISKEGSWIKKFENVDAVFHLASLADIVPSIKMPDLYFHSNVTGTLNVLEAMKENKVKKIFYAASSSCYGVPKQYPTKEDEIINPEYPYAFTKYIGELMIQHWSKVYKIDYISTRFFNVYGTKSRTSGTYGAMFGVFMAQKLHNKPLTIVGDGEQKRDFIYVTDLCNALCELLIREDIKNEIFNIGSGNPISVNQVAELIGGEKVYIPKRPSEPEITHADISKIISKTDWIPKISINEGVQRLIDDISYWEKAPVWDPDSIASETKLWFKYLNE